VRATALVISFGFGLGVATPVVYAGEDPVAQKVEKLAAEAAAAYRAADYQRAVELFERAYSLRQVGELLYNLAKAYEKLGDQDKAIEHYRRYIDSTEADPKLRQRAEARVTAYEATHKPRVVEPPPVSHPPIIDKPPVITHVPPPAETQEERQARADRAFDAKRRRDRLIGLTLDGVGLGCVIAGGALWGTASGLHTDYESSVTQEFPKRAEKNRAITEAAIGDGLWGAAAVAVAVGSYFVWRGFHPEHPPRVTAAPLLSPSAGGVMVGGAF
jgi:tetratricopeptide (TPR) repeat protein